jgi:hypothetical protein
MLRFLRRMSSGTTIPAALTVVPSVAIMNASWINLALNADRLEEELAANSADILFDRLCAQVGKPIDPDVQEEDKKDVYNLKRKGKFRICEIL